MVTDILVRSENSNYAFMDVVDADWIKRRLTGERGQQARLAEAMGIDNDKMSKILRGLRKVQADEVPKVIRFFNGETLGDLTQDEKELLSAWRRLSDEHRQSVQTLLQGLPASQADDTQPSSPKASAQTPQTSRDDA